MKAVLIVLAVALASAAALELDTAELSAADTEVAVDSDVEAQAKAQADAQATAQAAAAAGTEAHSEAAVELDAEGKPKKVAATVWGKTGAVSAYMHPLKVVIVPKGDPRARAPPGAVPFDEYEDEDGEVVSKWERYIPFRPFGQRSRPARRERRWPRSQWPWRRDSGRPVLQNAGCASQGGRCGERSACTGTVKTGLCPGAASIVCCIAGSTTPPVVTPPANCPAIYANEPAFNKKGNGNANFAVVYIHSDHLSDPSQYKNPRDDLTDNTMLKTTACKFAAMHDAAKAAGVRITINSGFRTYARQNYFYQCMLTKKCNGGNLAAKPGNSNHGLGLALDLNTSCSGQDPNSTRAPAACKSSAVYNWLLSNWRTFGIIRTVKKEPWHWEFRPNESLPSWAQF